MKLISTWSNQQNLVILIVLYALFGAGLSVHVLNLSFFLLLITAIVLLFRKPVANSSFHNIYAPYKVLHWAMASTLIALLVTQLGHGYIDLSPYNSTARLASFALLLWVMVNLPIALLRTLKWAWIVGAVLCAAQIYLGPRVENRPFIENWYVALASLLGIFSLLSLAWNERPGKLTILAHLFGAACGLYIIYECQTRGVWMALPLFIGMAYLTFVADALNKRNLMMLLIGMILFGLLFLSTPLVQNRIHQAKNDLQSFQVDAGNTETSAGTRLQLWNASWVMIKEHPLIGVGSGEHYKAALHEMVNRKVLPFYYNGAHTHNEILYNTATMGLPGFIAILLTYLVPGYYFGKHLLHRDRQTRAAAAMGVCVCAGFMIFGLVDVLFYYKETEVFYCLSCAVLFGFTITRKEQLLLSLKDA